MTSRGQRELTFYYVMLQERFTALFRMSEMFLTNYNSSSFDFFQKSILLYYAI